MGAKGEQPSPTPGDHFPGGQILWNNGESLKGNLVSANENTLHWMAPEFQEPLEIQLGALRRITVNEASSPPANTEAYRVQMRDGSSLQGAILAINDMTLSDRKPVISKRMLAILREVKLLQS